MTKQELKKQNNWKRILPGLIVSLICLAVIFYLVDLHKLIEALQLANYRLVFAASGLAFLWLVVRAMVWRCLLQEKATYAQVFSTVNEGYLLNNILPFRLGEIGRAFLLSEKASLSFWEVFSSILIERVLDVAFASLILLICLSFMIGANWAWQAAVGAIILVILGMSLLFLMVRNKDRTIKILERGSSRWQILNNIVRTQFPRFLAGLTVLTDMSRFMRALSLMALNWGIALLQYYLLLIAFIPTGKFLWSSFSLGISALGIAAPSSPGAIGVYELTHLAALSVFNVNLSDALAFALTAHLLNYLITGVIGAIALARDGETLTGLFHRIRRFQVDQAV